MKGWVSFVYLLHVVTHLWRLQCYHAILFWYGPACPKFSEITNHPYLWKGFSDFAEFIHVVTCILLDSHYNYRNMLFWVCTIRHRLWLSDFLSLKNSETIWGTKLIFGYHWSYEKYHTILGYGPLKFLVH